MAPVARELSKIAGVLEPIQTALSIDGQIQELHGVLKANSNEPVVLISHSWGAMLGVIFSSQFPDMIKKLILTSCGPLEAKYSSNDVMKKRLDRMSDEEKKFLDAIMEKLRRSKNKNTIFSELGNFFVKIDSYDPILEENELIEVQYDIFASVWSEAEKFRSQGGFEDAVKKIKCPTVAIHGSHDPHPYEGVALLCSSAIKDFKFILLENCGHYPWIERHAKNNFYSSLKEEVISN